MRLIAALLAALCALCSSPGAAENKATALRGWEKRNGYQYITLGVYPQEADETEAPVLWRVLEVWDGEALLLMEYILDVYPVMFPGEGTKPRHETHSFEESDLYVWLNGEMADRMLTPAEQAMLQSDRGRLFLLTKKEYRSPDYGFPTAEYGEQKARQCKGTPYALSRGLYRDPTFGTSPYWLNYTKAQPDTRLQIVGYNGHMSYAGYTRMDVGVRPAVRVALDRCFITAGEGSREAPYILTPR
ncbi:hypothetical protein FACS1894196_4460 [Clostridia bacterium]|nr:hypothetical protein FACS1894196_4460 [Clostridia bacterium]